MTTIQQESESHYCGLDCSFLLEQLDFILDMIIIHADYDPVFAPKMVQKLIDKCEEVKSNLMYDALQRRYPLKYP